MEENQTVPAMIPEGDFAAFLEGEKVETLLSPLGYAYCAEGQDADLRMKRLERLEVTARQRGATPPGRTSAWWPRRRTRWGCRGPAWPLPSVRMARCIGATRSVS